MKSSITFEFDETEQEQLTRYARVGDMQSAIYDAHMIARTLAKHGGEEEDMRKALEDIRNILAEFV